MHSRPEQALIALEYYLVRGKSLLECLNLKEFDKIKDIQQKRNFAFHNFRAAEALLLKSGIEITLLDEYKKLWAEIEKIDKQIETKLIFCKEQTLNEITQTREYVGKLAKYRSGKTTDAEFKQMI